MNAQFIKQQRTSTVVTTTRVTNQKTCKPFLKEVLLKGKKVKKAKEYLDLIPFRFVIMLIMA